MRTLGWSKYLHWSWMLGKRADFMWWWLRISYLVSSMPRRQQHPVLSPATQWLSVHCRGYELCLFVCCFLGGFFARHGSFLFILLNHLTQLQQTPRTATSLVFRCFAELFFIPCESLEKSTTCWHFFLIGCVSGGLRQKRCDNECKCTNSMDNWTIIGASLGSSVNICL